MNTVQKTLRITFILFFSILFFSCNNQNEKPNIVWLVTEDNSIHYMNLYQHPLPHLEDHRYTC